MKNKKLPIGVQTFSNLIERNYLYVDKTKYIYDIINGYEAYFLSRPRRFGKSLLISTLESIFLGRQDLFAGLYIKENTDYDFKKHPVIRLDMSQATRGSNTDVEDIIRMNSITAIEKNNLTIPDEIKSKKSSAILNYAIEELSKQEKVVVLIDEYDAPILNNLTNKKRCEEIKILLADFYGVLKSQNHNLRLIFLTGVTRFAGVSIFSGLNHLKDISLNTNYANLLGITQEELEENFKDGIEELSFKKNLNKQDTLNKIKYWYNGYTFSKDILAKVYNPFSTLQLFDSLDFLPHWFATGTPTFLIDLLKHKEFFIPEVEFFDMPESSFYMTNKDDLAALPVLYQAGYLTINNYDDKKRMYRLGYPNFEVKESLNSSILASYANLDIGRQGSIMSKMLDCLFEDNIKEFVEEAKKIFLNVPNNIHVKNSEHYYQTIFYSALYVLGFEVKAEDATNIGFIDLVLSTEENIYIFEFKLNGNAKAAIEQIIDKNYADKYKNDNKKITLIGIEFSKKERNIKDYQVIENYTVE